MTALFLMNRRVTGAAKRLQVIERVVSLLSRQRDASPVNMMNMQVFGSAAALACVVVALQGVNAVAVEGVIVLGALSVFLGLLGVAPHPVTNALDPARILAIFTKTLWPRRVNKITAAFCALENIPLCRRSTGIALFAPILAPLHYGKIFSAILAGFLVCSGRLVGLAAHNAFARAKTALGFTMSSKSAWLTSFLVWGKSGSVGPAIRAINKTVFSHFNPNLAAPQYDNARAL